LLRVCLEFVASMDNPVKLIRVNKVQALEVEFFSLMQLMGHQQSVGLSDTPCFKGTC
jgi:hypothetical protein